MNITDKEDGLFLQKIAEKCSKAIDTFTPTFTDFLDGRMKKIALDAIKEYAGKLICVCYGGFEHAERVKIGMFSKDVYGYCEQESELYELFDVAALQIKGSGFSSFGHRDVMGSVLGLGIKREALGDVYLPDEKSAYLCMNSVVAQYVCDNLEKVARDKVKVNIVEVDKLPVPQREFAVMSGTVASDRLDCIVSLCTGVSREKAKLMITSGNVNVNHFEQLKVDLPVLEEDVLSIRGYGRFVIKEHGGLTKKGRLKTVVHKMI
ncbi:MAG: hypothetical protein J6K12_07485 [Clostridia bacterium]|nr:hypothetical protein [Clostridia bacterium]